MKKNHLQKIKQAVADIQKANKDVAAAVNDPETTADEARQITDAFSGLAPDASDRLYDLLNKDSQQDPSDMSDDDFASLLFGT